MEKLYSFIVTTHSRPEMLHRALSSIRGLLGYRIEIVVVSDESDLETFLVTQNFLTSEDIFIKRNGINGPAKSRNVGIEMSQGDYLIFLDDDDAFDPANLKYVIDQNRKNINNSVFYWDYVTKSKHSGFDHEETVRLDDCDIRSIYTKNFIPNNCCLFPRNVIGKSRFDENLNSHEDWDFILSLLHRGVEFIHCSISASIIYHHSLHGQRNMNTLHSGNWGPNFLYIYRKWPAPPELKIKRRERLAGIGIRVPEEWI